MSRRVAVSKLNASTLDILNTIRANASYEYQSLVPTVSTEHDIPKVGEVLYGYPALANQFINALVNRIALVKVNSATFNNAYAELKKGYLEFGETVEEVFVGICKAREFSPEKAEAREFKRTLPDVRSAFHTMNWRVQYPITIQNEDLRMAFLNAQGVQDLIAKIIDAIYVSEQYDEYLLFKYLMIKAISHGKMYPIGVDVSDAKNLAKAFRGASNNLTFMNKKYNSNGVTTTTPKEDQFIFMDSELNAQYDVDVLAGAFNMDKATFIGKLKLIDDWTTFDNDRFEVIRDGSDMIEEVTDAELALMANVKAVLIDREWFQIYDNLAQMTEQYVASGMYWNYFYNTWKTVSSSPFSNAIVFVDDDASISAPASVTVTIDGKEVAEEGTVFTLGVSDETASLAPQAYRFIQTKSAVEAGVAVHKYGAIIMPPNAADVYMELEVGGIKYFCNTKIGTSAGVNDTFTFYPYDEANVGLSALALGNITLSPTFATGTYVYAGSGSTGASGKITATAKNSHAAVSATINGVAASMSATHNWADGDVVVVTVQQGAELAKSYTVTLALA